MAPIVEKLLALIAVHGWEENFRSAIEQFKAREVSAHSHIGGFDDYLRFIDEMVRWAPRESGDSRMVHDKLVEFYFILDQPALLACQVPSVHKPV